MKKFYVGAIALACSLSVFADEIQSVVSLSLVNLTKERLNTTHTDSKGNVIEVKTNEPKSQGELLYRTTTDNPLRCVNQTPSQSMAEYGFVVLKGHKDADNSNSPWIQITLPSSGNITAIQLLGFTAGSSQYRQVLTGFSDKGTADSDYYMNWEDPIADVGDPSFVLYSDECANQAEDNFENKRLVPEGAKYMKLIVSKSFCDGGVSAEEMGLSPYIYAIRFFAKDTPTGIEDNSTETLDIELFGRNLQLGELADVVIYDLTGRVVKKYANVDNAYLDCLNEGLYVVNATTENGVEVSQKIFIR